MRLRSAPFVGVAAGVAALLLAVSGPPVFRSSRAVVDRFDHLEHQAVFLSCATCHLGAVEGGAEMLPPEAACATCHDGEVEDSVEWRLPIDARPSNLAFNHLEHAVDTTLTCEACHANDGSEWMEVRGPEAGQCISCHSPDIGGVLGHLDRPERECASCHVPLTEAVGMTPARVSAFASPSDHSTDGFLLTGGHGAAAGSSGAEPVSASCSTCHVQRTCVACHVDAPELASIQALGDGAAAIPTPGELPTPVEHSEPGFELAHGMSASTTPQSCQSCHTQQSCKACHGDAGERAGVGSALHPAGPGRGAGAMPAAKLPTNHVGEWNDSHGVAANTRQQSCSSCHARTECLACHSPDPAQAGEYHPASFLVRHPAESYSRGTSCSDCHNQGEFCQSCHQVAGVTARRSLLGEGGYHDGNRQFFVGHGAAARQSLESCASCHVERDCLTCHAAAAVGGRGFSPHGPGFYAERLYKKNPTMCTACHGAAIPRTE